MNGPDVKITKTLRILVVANLVVLALLATNVEYPP